MPNRTTGWSSTRRTFRLSAGGGVLIVTGLGFFPVLRAAVDGDERFAPSSTRTSRWIALTRPDGKQKLRAGANYRASPGCWCSWERGLRPASARFGVWMGKTLKFRDRVGVPKWSEA